MELFTLRFYLSLAYVCLSHLNSWSDSGEQGFLYRSLDLLCQQKHGENLSEGVAAKLQMLYSSTGLIQNGIPLARFSLLNAK